MCQEEKNGLCHFCPHEEKCDEERMIQLHAIRYWNFDVTPPAKYKEKVTQFIHDHPALFKGASPQ